MRKKQFVRPNTVTMPNGEKVLARLQFPGSRELPTEGGPVPASGREGSWWARRIAEGSAVIDKSKSAGTKKPEPTGTKKPEPTKVAREKE